MLKTGFEMLSSFLLFQHMLLFELQRGVHGKRREGMSDLPLLEGLAKESHRLVSFLLQSAHTDR
jgi:hypothetical protein